MQLRSGGRLGRRVWRGALARQSCSRSDEAFTLIELMMVVMIIALLIAIAIPTFLGARQRASNRASQASLRLALTAETTYYADSQEFTDNAALLRAEELGLDWMGNAPSTGFKSVSTVMPAPPQNKEFVCLAVLSQTGQTYGMVYAVMGAANGTYYGTGTGGDAAAFCAAPPVAPGNWATDVQTGWRN